MSEYAIKWLVGQSTDLGPPCRTSVCRSVLPRRGALPTGFHSKHAGRFTAGHRRWQPGSGRSTPTSHRIGGPPMTSISGTDGVTASVIRSAMETVCFEMATYVSRTATTPILNQSNERNATVLDARGRLAALSVGVPQFMLSSTLPVQFALRVLRRRAEGPATSSSPTIRTMAAVISRTSTFSRPIFSADGDLLLIPSIQCHHGDTGGASAGGYNTTAKDIWSEGTRYPLPKDHRRRRRKRGTSS